MTFSTQIDGLKIRHANASDVELIAQLIKDLAEFEKLSHEVVMTPDDLQEFLFGAVPRAEVLIAEYQDKPAGFALFFHNFSTFLGRPGLYLEDLFVKPELRSFGIGRELLRSLAQIALSRKCGRMEWSVLNWNERAISFYKSLGSQMQSEWTVHRLNRSSIEELAGS